MTSYHVRVSVVGEKADEVKVDIDGETLDRQFLEPYRSGSSITINGRTIPIDRIERIRIGASDTPAESIIETLKREDERSTVAVFGGPSYQWRAAARSDDVTDQFITGPPGEHALQQGPFATAESVRSRQAGTGPGGGIDVFVVTGRDSAVTSAVVALLRSLGLRIIEWEHAVARTGIPNPYVGDVVEEGLRMADAAVIIITPDDVVRLRHDLVREDDSSTERSWAGQARPNVFYEAGFADALGRDRTVILEVGNVKNFSDITGRHVVRYDGSAGKRNALAERLRLAGLAADTSGQDWLHVGDVEAAVAQASAALEDEQ
jgi:predicted nucleotide-binding protein